MSVNERQVNAVLPGLIPAIREQVLADATARIEGLKVKRTGGDGKYESIYNLAIEDVLRTLAQPTAINREGAQVSFVVTDEKHHHESVDALAALNQPQTEGMQYDVHDPKWEFEGDPPRPPELALVPQTEGEKDCPDCGGSGFIPAPEHEWHDYRPCRSCSGTGKGNK